MLSLSSFNPITVRRYGALLLREIEGRRVWDFVKVHYQKGELHIVTETSVHSLEELKAEIGTGLPVILTIDLPGVIQKFIPDFGGASPEQVLAQNLPNIDTDRFYYSGRPGGPNFLLHIAKKEFIHSLLDELKQISKNLSHVVLGASALCALGDYLTAGSHTLGKYTIEVTDNYLTSLSSNSDTHENSELPSMQLSISGLQMRRRSILPFASILSLLQKYEAHGSLNSLNNKLEADFSAKKKFRTLATAALGFFLILLFANFFVFNHYYNNVETLKANMAIHETKLATLKSQNQRVEKMEQRIGMLQQSGNSRASYYLDQLAKQLPNSIALDELIYQPLSIPMRENKPVLTESSTILISGRSSDDAVFSEWITTLENQSWIESVETSAYDYAGANRSNFGLKLSLRHE